MAVVIINSVLGVYQESKAEKAIEALQAISAATSRVKRDGKILEIKTEDDENDHKEFVRIATMHRAKGLEFVGVILPRLNKGVWPLKPKGFESFDTVSQRAHLDGELSLLYVSITRAMKHVYLSGVGDVPAELSAQQP